MARPQKIWRLNYYSADPEMMAQISILGGPNEVRVAADEDTFASLRGGQFGGITFSPGFSNKINMQCMSSDLKYGGVLKPLIFPLTLLPVTPVTPFPHQTFSPPLVGLVPTIAMLSIMATSFVGI